MSTLVVKNLPDELHEKLKNQAQRNHRSMTKEVISLIEAGIGAQRSELDLPPPLKLKSGYRPTIDDIDAAIAEDQE